MKYFDKDTDWVFGFCKICWDFKKFVFSNPVDFETLKKQRGKCSKCESFQDFILNESKNYYESLNEENN